MCGKCPGGDEHKDTEVTETNVEVNVEEKAAAVETPQREAAVEAATTEAVDTITITAETVGKIHEAQKSQSRFRIPGPSECASCTGFLVCVLIWLTFWFISRRLARRRDDDTEPAPPRRVAIRHQYDVKKTTADALRQLSQSVPYSKYLKEKEVVINQEVAVIARRCREVAFTAGVVYLSVCYYYIQPQPTLKSMSNFSLLLAAIPYFLPMLGQECSGMFWSSFLSIMALGYGTNATKAVGEGCLYAITASALFLPALTCYQDALQRRRLDYLKLLQDPTQPLQSSCKCC